MLLCPFCFSKALTTDTRSIEKGSSIRRRRQCVNPDCAKRFTTYEDYSPDTKEFLQSRKNMGIGPSDSRLASLVQFVINTAGEQHTRENVEYSVDSVLEEERGKLGISKTARGSKSRGRGRV